MASNYQRKINNRSREKLIFIAVEGKTEEKYFEKIREELKNGNIKLEILPPINNDSHPKNILERLINEIKKPSKNYNKTLDSVCLVCDVDRYNNLSEVIKQAKEEKIQPIISNPCFEVWLYLYCGDLKIIDDTVHFDATPINQGELNSQEMKKIYKKSKVNHNNNHQIAIEKAQELTKNDNANTFLIEQKHRGKSHVYKLLQEIISKSK